MSQPPSTYEEGLADSIDFLIRILKDCRKKKINIFDLEDLINNKTELSTIENRYLNSEKEDLIWMIEDKIQEINKIQIGLEKNFQELKRQLEKDLETEQKKESKEKTKNDRRN